MDVLSWQLSDAQMGELNGVAPQGRMLGGKFFVNKKGPYKTEAELWDE